MKKKHSSLVTRSIFRPVLFTQPDMLTYWTVLLVLVLANIFASFIIVPFLFLASTFHMYLLIASLAIFFGYVFGLLMRKTQYVSLHHHLLALCMVPMFAIVSLLVLSSSLNRVVGAMGLSLSAKDPVTLCILYAVFFALPYFLVAIAKNRP